MNSSNLNCKFLIGCLIVFVPMILVIINNFKLLAGFDLTTQIIFYSTALVILIVLLILSLFFYSTHRFRKHFLVAELFAVFIGLGFSLVLENTTLLMITLFCLSFLFIINLIINRFLPKQLTRQ